MALPHCPSAGVGPEGILHRDSHRPVLSYRSVAGYSSWCSSSLLVLSLRVLQNSGLPLLFIVMKITT